MNLIQVAVGSDFTVEYDESRGMYRVCLFEKGELLRSIWFDGYTSQDGGEEE